MESFIIKALQLILSLSILVVVHELGHFLFAKLFKVRVEKFYLFFDAGFKLFKYKPKNSDTEYGIGWLPLGGYVKIAGMIDESMDREQLAQPPQPWEFRTKPAWQRLLIMVGGVMMNFILAFLIYSMVVFKWGDTYIPIDEVPVHFSELGHKVGFQDGDIIIAADGDRLSRLDDLDHFKIIDAKMVTVLRNGEEKSILLPEDFKKQYILAATPLIDVYYPARIDSIVPEGNAGKAGLRTGDVITSVNGASMDSYNKVFSEIQKNAGKEINLDVQRGNEIENFTLQVSEEGKIGIASFAARELYKHEKFGFFESFPAGASYFVRKMKFYVLQLKLVFTKEGIQGLGGFGAIGNLFPPKWDWFSFWSMTAFLSVILGIMNLLPIPALDGGHVMFLLYEVIARRKPNEKFMEYATMTGMVLLIGLILYANGNDIFRFFFK